MAFVIIPPLVLGLPVALSFLITVLRPSSAAATRLTTFAILTYSVGALVAGALLHWRARAVESAATSVEANAHVSACLTATEIISVALWVGWGLVLAVTGAVFMAPSLNGFASFGEAALLIAAPAMAWAYWAGKGLLLSNNGFAAGLTYEGRVYSIGVKIAMVFIGLFVVATGALVQLVLAHVTVRLHQAGVAEGSVAAEVSRYGLIVAIVTAALFGVATYFLARDITRPLQQLIRVAGEMAEGRFDIRTEVFSDDEIGALAASFGVTRDGLRSLIARVESSGVSISEYANAMTSGTTTLLEGAGQQRDALAESRQAVEAVRTEAKSILEAADKMGDLCYDSAGRAVELSASSGEVAQRMEELFRSVEKTTSSTTEIDATARSTSERTADLASVGNEVMVFVAEMDATVDEISKTAGATSELSKEVRENAAAGREAVEATVEAVRATQETTRRTAGAFEALQSSLREIDKILDFINELTDRTNLLSLNAAIIAAQAGENDFGFSVIADEVRQLADRTRNATKDIAAIVRNVQPITSEAAKAVREGVAAVDQTVELAHGATESLARILESADRSRDMAKSISAALAEQSNASRHLHEVTTRVSDTISEIQRATASQAEGTRLLTVEAERVSDIAAQVKRSTDEQMSAGAGIAKAMEQIVGDVRVIRDRLQRQLQGAELIASSSDMTQSIAERNRELAEAFTQALESLQSSSRDFAQEVARFKV